MFYNANTNEEPQSMDNVTEKVYVDWPEENNDDYRFVSSRMDDVESDYNPLVNVGNIKSAGDIIGKVGLLRTVTKPPRPKENKRYEDLSHKHRSRHKNSSIPPLDLISQHSSIEIPGAKGTIDIDFRSISDSMSEDNDQGDDQTEVDRDSLDENVEQIEEQNKMIYRTTLPDVTHEDLILNHGEYNSSRYHSDNTTNRRFSDISIPSQYKIIAPIGPHYSHYEACEHLDKEDDRVAFEAVQQRFKQSFTTKTHESTIPSKQDRSSANSLSKLQNAKPTMLVAPQIKQSFYEKVPNFIELNKVTLNQQKQGYISSYATKYADRQRKDSPKRSQMKVTSMKDGSLQTYNYIEKVPKNTTLSAHDYWTKRERSVERLTGEHNDHHIEDNQDQMQRNMMPQNKVVFAYTQYGEPLYINQSDIITGIPKPQEMLQQMYHVPLTEYYSQTNISSHNYNISATSPRVQRPQNQTQETRRSLDSGQIFKDAPYKRQPTLYDEKLLEKKTRIASSDKLLSHLPPLPGSSDSNISQNYDNSYSANLRKKEATYEQYTLRDFRNIKQINSVGGLGPNIGTESHKQMRDKLIRQKNYSKAVKEKNQELLRKRENEIKDQTFSIMNTSDNSRRDTKEEDQHNEDREEKSFRKGTPDLNQGDDKNINTTSKTSFASTNFMSKEQIAKRDVMINYAKSIKEKQIKRNLPKNKNNESPSAIMKKNQDTPNIPHELFNNSDLERLLQRHEYDKKMSDQLRQKWEKIP